MVDVSYNQTKLDQITNFFLNIQIPVYVSVCVCVQYEWNTYKLRTYLKWATVKRLWYNNGEGNLPGIVQEGKQ